MLQLSDYFGQVRPEFIAALSILVPFLTFLLGILASYLISQRQRKKVFITENAFALSDLSSDWYGQIYDIYVDLISNFNSQQTLRKINQYAQSRDVLPKFLRTIEALRGDKKAKEVVKRADEFLKLVAQKNDVKEVFEIMKSSQNVSASALACLPLLEEGQSLTGWPDHFGSQHNERYFSPRFDASTSDEALNDLRAMLQSLDEAAQEVSLAAGRLSRKLL